jgi:CoA:oxalate CoA-transferase
MAHPHLRARGTVRRVTEPTIGSFDIPGLPVKFSRWQPEDPSALKASRLGEDNVTVLMDVLGLSEMDVKELIEQRILVEAPKHSKD